jgi:4-hydroxy-tetrahydrodipicolinate synthase
VIGLRIGDYPYSRPPQAVLPGAAREEIRAGMEAAGLADGALGSTAVGGHLQPA